jgi:hypothetical protein
VRRPEQAVIAVFRHKLAPVPHAIAPWIVPVLALLGRLQAPTSAPAAPTAATFLGEPGEALSIDVAATPFKVSAGVRAFKPSGPEGGTMEVKLRGSMLGKPGKFGELLFDLRKSPLAKLSWGNRTLVTAELRVSPEFVGQGKRNWSRAHRGRLFLVDARGKRLYLPNRAIVDRPASSGGWLKLEGQPTTDVPIPLGVVDPGFDADRVRGLGVNVEAFNREGEEVAGTVELRRLKVSFEEAIAPRVMPPDPVIRAGEAERAARMNARINERCRVNDKGICLGVNLAWPTARSPVGEDMQLYGRILDGGERWFNRLWDIGEEAVASSVRKDFQDIRTVFGEGAVVRLWLFADLRSGFTFDDRGNPLEVTARADANMGKLLAIAGEEKVVLIPVLLDFVMADGVSRTGPDGTWKVGERADLITDAAKRARLVSALEAFVKPHADHPAILAWDVMNEPDNSVAVVTPAHFADLQSLVRELVDAVHRAGGLATVGHRNLPDPRDFFRGRVAVDLGQVHYYPFVDTRPNPVPFGSKLGPTFGPLPGGWGELQAIEGRAFSQLSAAKRAGHRLFLWWAWRGHMDNGDGFAVQPHAPEIKQAVDRLRAGKIPPPTP